MIVQARIKGHAAVSSAGMSPVNFGSRSAASKDSKLPGGISWLREVRVLQDPNPRLHNFPEVGLGWCLAEWPGPGSEVLVGAVVARVLQGVGCEVSRMSAGLVLSLVGCCSCYVVTFDIMLV